MNDDERREMLRLVELEYDRTTKFIEGAVGTTTSLRGWAITVWAGLIGVALSAKLPSLTVLAVLAVIAFAFVDFYYTSLYQQTLRRARQLERITNEHFDVLARGADNARLKPEADAALAAHSYGLYTNMRAVGRRELLDSLRRPQMFFWIYVSLAATALLIGLLAQTFPTASSSTPSAVPTPTATSAPAASP